MREEASLHGALRRSSWPGEERKLVEQLGLTSVGIRGLARAMCRPRCHVYFAWIRGGSYPAVAQFEHDARRPDSPKSWRSPTYSCERLEGILTRSCA